MTLPASGAISLNQVNVELGLSGTTTISMNQASVRTLFGVPSGAISMSNGYGKSNSFPFTISANTANANLRSLAVAAGWGGSSNVVATINSGVYVYSTSTGSPGLTINGAFPAGVTLINNGFIAGRGGAGGKGAGNTAATVGGAGGLALAVSVAVTINNGSGTIGGGGGGGGGADSWSVPSGKTSTTYGGAGGGGGRVNGTAGGGDSGAPVGNAGSFTAAGTGGSNGPSATGGTGGNFGSGGASGTSPGSQNKAGGASGAAITGNANITYTATGTRLGGIS